MQVKKSTKQLATHTIWRLPFRIRLQEKINLKRDNQMHSNKLVGKNTRSEIAKMQKMFYRSLLGFRKPKVVTKGCGLSRPPGTAGAGEGVAALGPWGRRVEWFREWSARI